MNFRIATAALFALLASASGAQVPGNIYSYSRTSSFSYYPSTAGAQYGLLQSETVEPNNAALCSTTTYSYDAFGNKNATTTSFCAGAPASAQFAPRVTGNFYTTISNSGTTPPLAITTLPSVHLGGNLANSTIVPGVPGSMPIAITNAGNEAQTQTFDPRFGTPLSVVGPNSLTTQFQVDDFGRKVLETRADGTSTVTYHCFVKASTADSAACAGLVFTSGEVPANAVRYEHSEPHDATGAKMGPYVRTFYDRLNRIVRESTESYDGPAQLATTSGTVAIQDTQYGQWGGATVKTQPYFLANGSSNVNGSLNVGFTCTVLDALGRAVQVYTADTNNGQHAFPASGQCSAAVVTGLGNAISGKAALTSLSVSGPVSISTNDIGQSRKEEKDALGHVVRVTDAYGATLVRTYDAFGNVVQTTDALQNIVSVTYDIRGRKVQMSDPDSGVWTYCYDALGQLTAQESPNQRGSNVATSCPAQATSNLASRNATAVTILGWTTIAYDALGRMTQRIETEYTTTWSYDANANGTACGAGVGRLCEVTTTSGEDRHFVYDSLGRPINTLTTISGALTSGTGVGQSFASATAYDTVTGRVKSQTYPSGLVVNSNYTTKGYLTSLSLGTAATLSPMPSTPGGTAPAASTLPAGTTLWSLQWVDARGRMRQQTYGNGVVTNEIPDASTGRVISIQAGLGTATNAINLGFGYDSLGNLVSRTDANGDGTSGSVTESMSYDALNRLATYTVSGAASLAAPVSRLQTFQYNALGNMLYRSDLGVYTYNASGAGAALPHALHSVAGLLNTTYTYDLQGNLSSETGGLNRRFGYTSFNLVSSATTASNTPSYQWYYDERHARIKEVRVAAAALTITASGPSGTSTGLANSTGASLAPGVLAAGSRTTWYLNPENTGGLSFEYEQTVPASGAASNLARHYLSAGGRIVGVLVSSGLLPAPVGTAPAAIASISLAKIEYWHTDHLGSLTATTDFTGAVTDRFAYDPFGKRRFTTGAYDTTGVLVSDFTTGTNSGDSRGYSGHEELDDLGIVNMNGRLYDPTLGRFIQPDPHIQSPLNQQSYNRYIYCWNNPYICTDPSGFDIFGDIFGWISDAFSAIGNFISDLWNNPFVRDIIAIVVAIEIGPEGDYALFGSDVAGAAYYNAAVAGFASGTITSNGNLDAGIRGAVTGVAFVGVGDLTQGAVNGGSIGDAGKFAENVALHAVVGCVSSVAGGGKCGSGALSAGFSALFTPVTNQFTGQPNADFTQRLEGTMVSAVVGGTASVLGGGKFANGAETGAFSYLFNELHVEAKADEVTVKINKFLSGTISKDGASVTVTGGSVTLVFDSDGNVVGTVGNGVISVKGQVITDWKIDPSIKSLGVDLAGASLTIDGFNAQTQTFNWSLSAPSVKMFGITLWSKSWSGTSSYNPTTLVLQSSGLLGIAARGIQGRQGAVDSAVDQAVNGKP